MNTKENKYLFFWEFMAALLLISTISIIAGRQNNGLEGDEVFSYISSTSMGGFKGICYLNDQTWYDAAYFKNAVTATGKECFNFKMVIENQVMDTHPPLYYFFLNLICSALEGRYSKWFGIGLNIFFMIFVETGLYLLILFFLKNRHISLITSTIFCCSYLTVNMTLFIRMYVLLMALILFQSWYHLKLYGQMMYVDKYPVKKYWKSYITLAVLTIAGGLTHYYFLVYQCLISAEFVLILWFQKRYQDMFRYIAVMSTSAVVYIALYPAAIYHIFFKYNGRDAVHKFLKESSMLEEVSSMLSSFNKQLFKGSLPYIILFLSAITIPLLIKGKMKRKQLMKLGFLIVPSLIYFYGISKASPFITIRYVSPIATLIYTAIIVWAKYLIDTIKRSKIKNIVQVVSCVFLFFTTFYFFKTPVKDTYFSEKNEIVKKLSKEADYCVYISGYETNWKMWEDYINYPMFQGLYFIDGQKQLPITDKKLIEQKKLVIYIDTLLGAADIFAYLETYLPLQQYEIQYETSHTYIVLGQ